MNNTEKIQLPDAGASITVTITSDSELVINNWKGIRYYFKWNYSTGYNNKSRDLGWIATDGSEDKTTGFGSSEVREILNTIRGQVIKE